MQSSQAEFPTRAQLYRGAVLRTIIAALWAQRDPGSPAVEWKNMTYLRDDEDGTRGAVAFAGDRVVATFFDHESSRSPFPDRSRREYDWRSVVAGMPADFLQLLEERVFPWTLMDFHGQRTPVITAVLWGEGDRLTSSEPWPQVRANGGFILELELMEPDEVIEDCTVNFEFSPDQVTAVRRLFEQRMAAVDSTVLVPPNEQALSRSGGAAAEEKSRSLLAAIGITLPA